LFTRKTTDLSVTLYINLIHETGLQLFEYYSLCCGFNNNNNNNNNIIIIIIITSSSSSGSSSSTSSTSITSIIVILLRHSIYPSADTVLHGKNLVDTF